MLRKIPTIDIEKCDACGLCVSACHEGAIAVKNGKAHLIHANLCDGLGNCLPVCPTGAIGFKETEDAECTARQETGPNRWPLQIKLVPVQAPYFENSALLIAADCSAYAYPRFHEEFMRDAVTLIGCPKLDNVDYGEKLSRIIAGNSIESLTVARMEVPCCGGLERALSEALKKSGKTLPLRVITLSIDGHVLEGR